MKFGLKSLLGTVAFLVAAVIITLCVINFISIPLPGGSVILSARDYEVIRELRKFISIRQYLTTYYYKETDPRVLEEGAIRGMLEALEDPYTVYMDKLDYDNFITQTIGIYEGVGIVVEGGEDGYIQVVAPIEDTPGDRAGLKTADRIIKVDGKEVYADQLDQAVAMMKGPEGTEVVLTILREGLSEPFDVKIIREEIRLVTVKSDILEGGTIGYVRITTFDEKTEDDFNVEIKKLKEKGIRGLILDLRGNPGGVMDEVVKIADLLMGEGLIVYTENRQGKRLEEFSDKEKLGLPLAVLVDEGSASASEILAGAIQDSGTGVLVGTKTFGKALVQTVQRMNDGSAIKMTTAQYYTPKGRSIQGKGIQPDYVVELPEDAVIGEYKQGKDPQLAKAVELVKSEMRSEQ
jgi:carboxyl-terminal processing protease